MVMGSKSWVEEQEVPDKADDEFGAA